MNIELKTKRQKSDAELAVTLCTLVVVAGTATTATPFWPDHLGDAPPLGVVVLSLGLALAKLHYTLGWWRDLDEAAREAHKSAWWTGGNIGLIVAGAALAACVLSGFDPMPARFAGIPAAYATAGVLGVIAAQAIGYGVAWMAWWGAPPMSAPLTSELTNHVEALRTERNWTRTDLAQRLGVSRQTLRAIENGRYAPSLSLALRIADAFERPLDTLFTR